jgi:hypothetical protein
LQIQVLDMREFERDQEHAQVASKEEPIHETRRFSHDRPILCVLISVTLAFCLIAGALALIYQGHRSGNEQKSHTECGASLAEFQANGCVFDLLSYTWMPARCKDPATSEDFLSWLSDPQKHLGPWPFFKNRTVGSSLAENRITSEVEFGNRWDMDIWSSMEEHLAHCMFLFLHVSRVAVGEALLRTSDTFPHAEHCFHAIWKGLDGTWDLNEDRKANQKIEIETTTC